MPHLPAPSHRRLSLAIIQALFFYLLASALLLLGVPAVQAQSAAEQKRSYSIPAGNLDQVLNQFASQADILLAVDAQLTAGKTSPGLTGSYTLGEALSRLLAGTELRVIDTDGNYALAPAVEGEGALELKATTIGSQVISEREAVYQSPTTDSVITSEQMERRNIRHMADILEETPGIYSTVALSDPSLTINIRGIQDYGRINMNIDGMRQNFNMLSYQNYNGSMYMDPDFLSGVKFKKSSSSGAGGAGAYGGIATFVTIGVDDILKEDQEFGGRIRASHGVGGDGNGMHFIGSSALAIRNEVWDGLLAYSERHIGNYSGGNNRDHFSSYARNNLSDENSMKADVKYTDNDQHSELVKLGLNLPEAQRLEFIYISTSINTPEGDIFQNGNYPYNIFTYKESGGDEIETASYALEYSLDPEHNELIDLKAKLYYVDTSLDRYTAYDPVYSTTPEHTSYYKTKTYGVQVENTARFNFSELNSLVFNHGFEFNQDEHQSEIEPTDGFTDSTQPWPEGASGTPVGKRWLASLYGQLDYEYGGWLTSHFGLRYDHTKLFGKTGYQTYCIALNSWPVGVKCSFTHDLNDEDGAFSPTIGFSIKPGLDWLQLFANAGKGWRPAGVTEVFATGRPYGGASGRRFFPNPYLEAERSRNFEFGFNIFKESLLFAGDRFGLKVAHFNNKVENFIYMRMGVAPYGSTWESVSNMAYVNNEEDTLFRGNEYSLDYSVRNIYLQVSYTKLMVDNEYCSSSRIGGLRQEGTDSYRTIINGRNRTVYGSIEDVVVPADCFDSAWGQSTMVATDRGSLVLGSRWLDNSLDVGIRVRYSPSNEYLEPADSQGFKIGSPYTLYDLYGLWQVSDDLRLSLTVDNVMNQAYILAGAAMVGQTVSRGRTMVAGLEYKF